MITSDPDSSHISDDTDSLALTAYARVGAVVEYRRITDRSVLEFRGKNGVDCFTVGLDRAAAVALIAQLQAGIADLDAAHYCRDCKGYVAQIDPAHDAVTLCPDCVIERALARREPALTSSSAKDSANG